MTEALIEGFDKTFVAPSLILVFSTDLTTTFLTGNAALIGKIVIGFKAEERPLDKAFLIGALRRTKRFTLMGANLFSVGDQDNW